MRSLCNFMTNLFSAGQMALATFHPYYVGVSSRLGQTYPQEDLWSSKDAQIFSDYPEGHAVKILALDKWFNLFPINSFLRSSEDFSLHLLP